MFEPHGYRPHTMGGVTMLTADLTSQVYRCTGNGVPLKDLTDEDVATLKAACQQAAAELHAKATAANLEIARRLGAASA